MERVAKFDIVIYVPYDKETMFLRELYIMNVPLSMPSPRCFVQWFREGYNVCAQRINWMHMPEPGVRSSRLPSPNSVELDAMEHWLNYPLFNELPHITLFDSIDGLVQSHLLPLLLREDWQNVLANRRQRMAETNKIRKQEVSELWRSIVDRIASVWETNSHKGLVPSDFDADMYKLYGVEVPHDNRSFPLSRDLRNFRATPFLAVLGPSPSSQTHIEAGVPFMQEYPGKLVVNISVTLHNIQPLELWNNGILTIRIMNSSGFSPKVVGQITPCIHEIGTGNWDQVNSASSAWKTTFEGVFVE